jgi:hypothetical protein
MKFIKLTSFIDNKPIFINPETIGHIFEATDIRLGKPPIYTSVGTTCHNNGGFKIVESPDEILKMIMEDDLSY